MPAPVYVTGGSTPYRPEIILWLALPDDLVVGTALVDPSQPVRFADTLLRAIDQPLAGAPRRPDRIRVADAALATELRLAVPDLDIVVAPTPELDAVLDHMRQHMTSGPPPSGAEELSYLEQGRIAPTLVERLFRAAEVLHRLAPWKVATDKVMRVDIPQLGVDGAALTIIGGLGESLGFLLFPSIDGYDAFLDAAERRDRRSMDLGTTWLSLDFERATDLPETMRREVMRQGWPVAGPAAYPVLRYHDRDGMPRPLTDRDVQVATACAHAVCSFFALHRGLFGDEDFEPVSETFTGDDEIAVRLTLPFVSSVTDEAAQEAPTVAQRATKPERNAPCPCGSGKKYKKCCLVRDEQRAGEDAKPARVHHADERLVHEMSRFARERFGRAWFEAAAEAFVDPGAAIQLFMPWSVYGIQVERRPIVEWFLQERGPRLPEAERAWLESQRAAWMTIWEVIDVEPGRTVSVKDLLTGEERHVHEVSGSKTLKRRDAVLGRVVDHGGVSVFCGIHQRPLPPYDAAEVVSRVRGKLRKKKTAVPIERLRDDKVGRYLIERWEEQVEDLGARRAVPPNLHNTDGDELLLTTDHFAFRPAERDAIAARLGRVDGLEPPDGDDEDPAFTFVRPGNKMNRAWDNTIIGTVRVLRDSLTLECNSIARADALRSRLEASLGKLVRHVVREHSDPIALMKDRRGVVEAGVETPDDADLKQLGRAFRAKMMSTWPDQPVPALGGKTPRQAVRTKKGRAAVDLLLKEFENQEARLAIDDRIDIAGLRRDLDLPSE